MAFGDTIQTAVGTAVGGAATLTFSPAATAGNILLLMVGRSSTHGVGGSWGTPTGFTNLPNTPINSGNLGGGAWYKIAAGGETTVTTNGTNESGNWCAAGIEIEGPFAASPLDVSTESEANISTVVTSQTSGTTGTTSQNDTVALAGFAADNGSNVDGSRVYSNSFAEAVFASSGSRACAMIARKVLTATGAVECTFSCTDTGDEMYGLIAVFKKLAAAGPAGKGYSQNQAAKRAAYY
jgi:hypothetical protein